MLKILLRPMLEASNVFYGDSIGLAPIALAKRGLNDSPLDDGTPEDGWARDYDR